MASVLYTRERLINLTPTATTLDELLRLLGLEPTRRRRIYLRRKLTEFDIRTPHFPHQGTVYTKELLESAVAVSVSFAGVVRHLNLRQAGGTQAHIARRIRHFGIDTSHFTGQAHNRGQRTSSWLPPEDVLVQRPPEATRIPGVRLRLALVESGRPDVCEGCGTGVDWHGKQLTLEVDHIDGDWSDSRPENLRILCPNCHSTTETYCGRNRGRLRSEAPRSAE